MWAWSIAENNGLTTRRPRTSLAFALAAAEQRQLQLGQSRQVAFQLLDLLAERVHVLELAVDRGEAHVGDLVEVLQLAHHQLAELARRHFTVAAAAQVVDDGTHGVVHVMAGHRPLLQRTLEAHPQLALVEHLAPFAAFHDGRQLQLGRLVGVEALAALLALAPTAHAGTVVGEPRVDHAGVFVLAEGAMHPWRISRTPGISCTVPSPRRALSRSPPGRPAHPARRRSSSPARCSPLRRSRGW